MHTLLAFHVLLNRTSLAHGHIFSLLLLKPVMLLWKFHALLIIDRLNGFSRLKLKIYVSDARPKTINPPFVTLSPEDTNLLLETSKPSMTVIKLTKTEDAHVMLDRLIPDQTPLRDLVPEPEFLLTRILQKNPTLRKFLMLMLLINP